MLKRNNLPRPLGRLTLMVFLWLPMNSCWLLCHTSLEPWCLSIVFMWLPLHWIHVHVVGHESHGTYSQYQCATKLPISRVTCHLPDQTSIGNSLLMLYFSRCMLNSSTLQKFSNFCPECNVFVGSSRYLAALSGTGPTRLPCQPVTRLRKTKVMMMKEMEMMMMKEM